VRRIGFVCSCGRDGMILMKRQEEDEVHKLARLATFRDQCQFFDRLSDRQRVRHGDRFSSISRASSAEAPAYLTAAALRWRNRSRSPVVSCLDSISCRVWAADCSWSCRYCSMAWECSR